LLAMAVGGIATPLFLYIYDRASNTESAQEESSGYRFPKPRHEIKGFRFDGTSGDKRVITIEADRFRIEKKKVGFFRFAMMNVATLENASVHIFKSVTGPETGADSAFKDAFSKDALPVFSTKRVSSIEMAPVCVALYEGKSVVSRIRADSAIVCLKHRDVLFEGNVKVASGPRSLTTDRLRLLTEKTLLKTEGRFVLKTNKNEERGNKLTADIFLKRVRQREP